MEDVERIRSVIAPVIEGLGLSIVRIGWGRQGRSRTLRIDLDRRREGPVLVPYKGSGITSEELTGATREVSAVLDVHDMVKGSYMLEVSSPGLDRPLVGLVDFVDFTGHVVSVTLYEPHDGRRRLRGTNLGVKGEGPARCIVVKEGELEMEVPFVKIQSAHLVTPIPGLGSGGAPRTKGGKKKPRR